MTRTPHPTLFAAAAFGLALLAGPASAEAGPGEMLRQAQAAMRGGQTAQASEMLERAETRLLTGAEPARPARGEPAFHASEARRALASRDRAEAMRHTNMAIAAFRDTGAGSEPDGGGGARQGAQGGGPGGGPGAVGPGMGVLIGGDGRAVVRDGGAAGASVSRAEGVVLAQTGTPPGGRNAPPTGLPPGDTLPGWSGQRGGVGGGATSQTFAPPPAPLGSPPSSVVTPPLGQQTLPSGPSSSGLTGGEPARVGGSPPGDTSRSPGSSGIGGSGVGGPLR